MRLTGRKPFACAGRKLFPARPFGASGSSDAAFGIILSIQLAIIFVITPLAATQSIVPSVVEFLRLALAATTILIVARRWVSRVLTTLAFAATLAAMTKWQVGEAVWAVGTVKSLVTMTFDLVVAFLVACATFGPGQVTGRRILGGIIIYLYIGLLFAEAYRSSLPFIPTAFQGLSMASPGASSGLIYFSFGALTTSGSGQVVALHPAIRSAAALEAVIGQLYPVTLLGRLVSLHIARQPAMTEHAHT